METILSMRSSQASLQRSDNLFLLPVCGFKLIPKMHPSSRRYPWRGHLRITSLGVYCFTSSVSTLSTKSLYCGIYLYNRNGIEEKARWNWIGTKYQCKFYVIILCSSKNFMLARYRLDQPHFAGFQCQKLPAPHLRNV